MCYLTTAADPDHRPLCGGARQGDIRVVDPIEREAFSSLIAIRRKLGLPNRDPTVADARSSRAHVSTNECLYKKVKPSLDHHGGQRTGTRSTPGMPMGPPPPPDGWVWPAEGEPIEVEVAVSQGAALHPLGLPLHLCDARA